RRWARPARPSCRPPASPSTPTVASPPTSANPPPSTRPSRSSGASARRRSACGRSTPPERASGAPLFDGLDVALACSRCTLAALFRQGNGGQVVQSVDERSAAPAALREQAAGLSLHQRRGAVAPRRRGVGGLLQALLQWHQALLHQMSLDALLKIVVIL